MGQGESVDAGVEGGGREEAEGLQHVFLTPRFVEKYSEAAPELSKAPPSAETVDGGGNVGGGHARHGGGRDGDARDGGARDGGARDGGAPYFDFPPVDYGDEDDGVDDDDDVETASDAAEAAAAADADLVADFDRIYTPEVQFKDRVLQEIHRVQKKAAEDALSELETQINKFTAVLPPREEQRNMVAGCAARYQAALACLKEQEKNPQTTIDGRGTNYILQCREPLEDFSECVRAAFA